ncbi:MAG: isochorismatase family protein [Deltaproteobacteria bacterium]|nr:isochorismatase family protein [Deltaproteobacteria bacterium]
MSTGSTDPRALLKPSDALLLVDVQVDFCPGGALPIPGGDEVVPVLNRWVAAAVAASVPVYASRDWHPRRHPSFASEGGPWPVHCLQDSPGASFHPELRLPPEALLVSKGTRFDHDQPSAFDETGLAAHLRRNRVERIWMGGLALDVCVLATALDARRERFEVCLIEGGSRPITEAGGEEALAELGRAGVRVGGGGGCRP